MKEIVNEKKKNRKEKKETTNVETNSKDGPMVGRKKKWMLWVGHLTASDGETPFLEI